MSKIYTKLVESFGYLAEAPVNDTGYDPDKVQYAYQDGKANPNWPGNKPPAGPDTSDYTDPRGTDNVTNDPNKPKPTPKPGGSRRNAGTRAFQHWLNSKGIKVAVDGIWGPETAAGNDKYFNTYVYGKKMPKEQQDEYEAMRGVGTAHNVRVTPGSGNMYIGSPEYLAAMKKYGYDPKTGDPIGGAKPATAAPGQSGQQLGGDRFKMMGDAVSRLEALLKKYNIQAECALNKDGSLLTEDDWVLKHIDLFTEQEKMEIWKIISEAPIEGDFKTRQQKQQARDAVKQAYQSSQQAAANYNAGATATAQNMPQQQTKLSKFTRNLGSKFGVGGGKRAAAKGIAKLGMRAIPFLGTAWLLYDIGSALYDTFATTEIADMTPEDQEAIAKEIKTITEFSKSADYNNAPEDLKKRITAVLNSANKLAQQAEA